MAGLWAAHGWWLRRRLVCGQPGCGQCVGGAPGLVGAVGVQCEGDLQTTAQSVADELAQDKAAFTALMLKQDHQG